MLRPALCLPCLAKHPNVTLGEPLKAHRAAAGLTCEQLAVKVALTASATSHYEVGLREPSPMTLARLAEVLGPGLADGGKGK